MEEYGIGEIAKLFGVSRDTLRLYDRLGIVSPEKKPNGYRSYSRNNMIALAYVMHLRKTELSLEQIRVLVNDTNIENSQKMLSEQVRILQDKIERLQNIKNIVREYAECFQYGLHHSGVVNVEENITLVRKNVDNNSLAVQTDFASPFEKYKFAFSFIGEKELFLRDRIDNPTEVLLKMTYAISAVFRNGRFFDARDFSTDHFTIVPPRNYVFSVIKCCIPYDYDAFNDVLAYIKANNLEIEDDVLFRNLSLRNGPERNIDYYEVYVPVRKEQ